MIALGLTHIVAVSLMCVGLAIGMAAVCWTGIGLDIAVGIVTVAWIWRELS